MSILIKGMEMPKSCWDCRISHAYFDGNEYWPWCESIDEVMYVDETQRHDNCPLIELPPHRRLIDILDIPDVLRNYFDIGDSYVYNLTRVKEAFAVGTVHLDDFVEWDETDIDELTAYISANAPTIVEAEGEK